MKIIIALGSNTNQRQNILTAQSTLRAYFPDIKFSEPIWTSPINVESEQFLNCTGSFSTDKKLQDLQTIFKQIEFQQGDSHQNHQKGKVIIDIDLAWYGDTKVKDIIWQK